MAGRLPLRVSPCRRSTVLFALLAWTALLFTALLMRDASHSLVLILSTDGLNATVRRAGVSVHNATSPFPLASNKSEISAAVASPPAVPAHLADFERQWRALGGIDLTEGSAAHRVFLFDAQGNPFCWRSWHATDVVLSRLRCGEMGSPSHPLRSHAWVETDAPSDAFMQLHVAVQCGEDVRAVVNVTDVETGLSLVPFEYLPTGAPGTDRRLLFRSLTVTRRLRLGITFVGRSQSADAKQQCTVRKLELAAVASSRSFSAPTFLRAGGAVVIASLASTVSRPPWMLQNAVNSIYPFVSKVRVFLNGHEHVPDFLANDTRIEVALSRLHGDRGDANKFHWAEKRDSDYSVIMDDDLFYPPDYVGRHVARLRDYANRVVVGNLCVFVGQLDVGYYRQRRYVHRHVVSNAADYAVHVLGTGTVVYPTHALRLRPADFELPNVADVWFALKGQEQRVPFVCGARADNWILQAPTGNASIFNVMHDHVTASGYGQDLARMHAWDYVDASLQRALPIVAMPLVFRGVRRPKAILAVSTWNRHDLKYLQKCIEGFLRTRSTAYEWTVIVADDGSSDGTLTYLDTLASQFPHELFVIRNNGRYAGGQTNTMFELASKIDFDVGFRLDDDIVFKRAGWDDLYFNAIREGPYEHLAFLHVEHRHELDRKAIQKGLPPGLTLAEPVRRGLLEAHVPVQDAMGAFFTFTPKLLQTIGYVDELNFPTRGQWHTDYSTRACRAGFNLCEAFFDAAGSNDYLDLQNMVNATGYRSSLPWGDQYKAVKEPLEVARRWRVINDTARVYVPHRRPVLGLPLAQITPNAVFDKIYVMNLDRRPQRWERVLAKTQALGMAVHRFSAVNGSASPHIEEFLAYQQRPLVRNPGGEMGVRTVASGGEYLLDYDSRLARVAYMENKLGRKVIKTAGAWGYLKTFIAVLKEAHAAKYRRILVLDDDALFHRNFSALFDRVYRDVPTDWKILQLGSRQFDWTPPFVQWVGPHLYTNRGTGVGSFAVGIDRSAYLRLLTVASEFDLPFDEGALQAVLHDFPLDCFVMFPNLVIPNESFESDIGSSVVRPEDAEKAHARFRWNMDDYGAP